MKSVFLSCAALLIAASPVAVAQTTSVPSSHSAAPAVSSGTMNKSASSERYSTDNALAGQEANAGGMFTSVPSQEDLSSKVVGLNVYNDQNTKLGTIKDIAFDRSGVKAYIVSVGGFLGMGDHYVAVKPSAVNIAYNSADNKWRASMNTSAADLKAAPEYKYSSNG